MYHTTVSRHMKQKLRELTGHRNSYYSWGFQCSTLSNSWTQEYLIYKTLHPKIVDYTFVSIYDRAYGKTDHILGLKTYLNKFKSTATTESILFNQNKLILEINNRKKSGKSQNTWK